MAWCETYDDISNELEKRNIKHVAYSNGLNINNQWIGCCIAKKRGSSFLLQPSYDNDGVECKYFFVLVREDWDDNNPILILFSASFMEDRKAKSVNILDVHQYALDIEETFFPKSVSSILGKAEMVEVSKLNVA
jgi:hypothetical protein